MSVLYMRKFSSYEHHFLLAGFGSQMPSIATLFVTFIRSPWRLNSASPTLQRTFPGGTPLPQSLIEEAGKAGAGRIGFILMER